MRWMLRSKIHKAVVTAAELNYIGSITIDQDLLDLVKLWPGEKVSVSQQCLGSKIGNVCHRRRP